MNKYSYNKYIYQMISSAMDVIKELKCEELVKNYDADGGFMFSQDPEIKSLMLQINDKYGGHSGASFAHTMRSCQYLLFNLSEWDDICSSQHI